MIDIDFGKVVEALALLGLGDTDSIRSVVMDPHEVTVTRYIQVDGQIQLDEHNDPGKHPFEDAVLHEKDKALLYTQP